MNKVFYSEIIFFTVEVVRSDTKNYGNDKLKIRPPFFYYFFNSKTICRILLKLIPYICYEILHFTHFFIYFSSSQRQLLSLSNLVRVQRDPALSYRF